MRQLFEAATSPYYYKGSTFTSQHEFLVHSDLYYILWKSVIWEHMQRRNTL